MTEISKILMPVDFSECSWSALRHAASLGNQLQAAVDVLHVWEPPRYIDMNRDVFVSGRHQTLEQFARGEAELEMQRFLATLERCGSSDVQGTIASGVPHKTIVEAAQSGYDLVVMGTHGRTGLSHLMLGSVAEKVIRQVECPVMTVRQPRRQSRDAGRTTARGHEPTTHIHKLLTAVDFSDCSQKALAYALRLADQISATVDVLHVSAAPGFAVPHEVIYIGESKEPLQDYNRRHAQIQLDALLQQFGTDNQLLQGHVASGEISDEIPAFLAEHDYDLAVVGTHGRRGWAHLVLGSVAEQVIRRSQCPVLTVRATD